MPELVEADMEKELWSQIGILHGGGLFGDSYGYGYGQEELDEEEIKEIDSARARRRKAAYERVIASGGGANSLILSNYAQLLYEFDKDINRCFLAHACMHANCKCNPSFNHDLITNLFD